MRQFLRIATRKSPLALWQAEFVKASLLSHYPEMKVELIKLTTSGDRFLNQSLSKIGGKGLFTKELEKALIEGQADFAVHSMKDVPTVLPDGLTLSTTLKRSDPRDALITSNNVPLSALGESPVIGTSSLRRAIQIKKIIPTATIKPLRGNINTRLSKLSDFDGIILAATGLKRLNLDDRISHYFEPCDMIPAAGQGALGIECRSDDAELIDGLKPLNCDLTESLIACERHLNHLLNGRCDVPIAAFATAKDNSITLNAMVGSMKRNEMLTCTSRTLLHEPLSAAKKAANELISKGAKALLLDND